MLRKVYVCLSDYLSFIPSFIHLFIIQGFKQNLFGVFCLAENAVGPQSARPDDVHTMYSGL